MSPEEVERLKRLYEGRLSRYGRDIRTVGWRSKRQQRARFLALAGFGSITNRSVLDVGCGFGEFLSFLIEEGETPVRYTGIDLSEGMVRTARDIHKESDNAAFLCGSLDVLREELDRHNVVVASGILNVRVEDNYRYAENTLEAMYQLATTGIAVNMMSDYVDYRGENLFHYSPERIFQFAQRLTRRVCLRHDYMPFEFTVHLHTDQRIDEDHMFSESSARTLE